MQLGIRGGWCWSLARPALVNRWGGYDVGVGMFEVISTSCVSVIILERSEKKN
jgi:hypothetical protein